MSSKEYALMKFNILTMALHPELRERIDDAYAYAWSADVYPIFHGAAPWHEAFEDDFQVSKEMMEELSRRLAQAWNGGEGTAPTFYELESLYDARYGDGKWDRSALIGAMRYMALCPGRFDEKFFAEVTRDAGAPTEANSFAEPMNRDREIYFM